MRAAALVLALLAPLLASAQTPGASELDARIEALRAAYGTPGLAVAVVQGGRVVYTQAFGHRDIERRLPATTETAFPVGSVSKMFTASLMGMYEAEGRLALTDRPAQHLPELRFRTPAMDALVTVEDLITHRSGIGSVDGALVYFPDTTRQTLRPDRLAHLEPGSRVRERLDYSNAAYGLLGTLAECVSGQSWADEMHDRIFTPLGMTRSGTSIFDMQGLPDVATGYAMVGGAAEPGPYEPLYEASPGGSVVSTVSDLARWLAVWMADGQHEGEPFLSADFVARALSIHSFWQPSYDPDARDLHLNAYGYGWGIFEFEDRLRVAHSGATSGFTARVEFLPREDIGVVVLTNQHNSGIPDWVAEIAYRHLLELPARETESFPVNVLDVAPIVRDSGSVAYPELNRQSPPTHPLARYTGAYSHPGYGTFTVALRDGALYADLPTLSFALQHEHANTFVLRRTYEIHVNTPSFPVLFRLGYDGAVTGASIPLQDEPVVFARDLDGLRAEARRRLEEAERRADPTRSVAEVLEETLANGAHTEASINALGYEYLGSDRLALAVAVLAFNAEAFPDSWNAHDSHGEALAAAGRTREAIAAYERSLALNPDNTNGRAVLDRLRPE